MRGVLAGICVLLAGEAAGAPAPRLYLPFDGDTHPAMAAVGARVAGGNLEYVPAVRDRGVRLTADCRVEAPGALDVRQGTIAFWLRPLPASAPGASRVLFCTYGDRKLRDSYQRNRFSIVLAGDKLQWTIYDAAGRGTGLEAAAAGLADGRWHHVAATWQRINSGRADAEMRLYVDGEPAGRREGLELQLGATSGLLDIGRDSDASPDYARADMDDFYLYGQSLAEAELKQGIEAVRGGETPRATADVRGAARPGWWNDAWPYRVRAAVEVPPGLPPRSRARLPLDWEEGLARWGIFGRIDPASVRVVRAAPASAAPAAAEPAEVGQGEIAWSMPAGAAAGDKPAWEIYFDVVRFDVSCPLCVMLSRHDRGPAPAERVVAADYAAEAFDDAWDFDEGDLEAIDGFSRDIRTREVRGGVLRLEVGADPYIIWGEMWGRGAKTHRPITIDLARYPVLAMRVRQSVAAANWRIFGRPQGSDDLLRYEFPVAGAAWQVVRIDLRRTAGWKGILTALRIDPTLRQKQASVEIDWIRLTSDVTATRQAVELWPDGGPRTAEVRLSAPASRVPAGDTLTLTAQARDAAGRPVAGQPLSIGLSDQSGGRLEAPACLEAGPRELRGLTDAQGRLAVQLQASRRAGAAADVAIARADHTGVASPPVAIETTAGPASRYTITPSTVTAAGPAEFPRSFRIQLADQFGNPLAVHGRKVASTGSAGLAVTPGEATTDQRGGLDVTASPDAAAASVFSLAVRDGEGLGGRSGPLVLASAGQRPNAVRLLPNGYFAFADRRPFVPLGGFYANWVQRPTPDGEWRELVPFTDTTDEEKRQWMRFLREQGVTALRFMLRTHRRDGMEPLDVGGKVNRALLGEVLRYMDLAREYELLFQLVIHEDYNKPVYCNSKHLQLYARPAFAGVDLRTLPREQRRFIAEGDLVSPPEKYTDNDALACQDRYVRELIPLLRGHPLVFAYELENEMVNCPASWANHAADLLRALDPQTPVCVSHGGGGLFTADPAWWLLNTKIDFYSPHVYPHGTTQPDLDYGAVVAMLARYSRMAGVSFLGESAGDEFNRHPDATTRRYVMRDVIWMSLTAGHPGVFFWNARGAEIREFRQAHQAMGLLDLATLRRAKPALGIDVRHAMPDDKFFRSEAGRAAYGMAGRYVNELLCRGVDFDFTLQPQHYRRVASVERPALDEAPEPIVAPSPGWQASTLCSEDGTQVLVYVRNYAGVEPWDVPGQRKSTIHLRRRAVRPLSLDLRLPEPAYDTTVMDLDAQTARRQTLTGHQRVDFGATEHDMVLVLRAKPRPR